MINNFHPINFSPFATNVIECCDRSDLITRDGQKVSITRGSYGFKIIIGDKITYTDSNVQASWLLNSNEVGCTE